MSLLNKAIGGYFELELPQGLQEKYPNALKYQSARAAFLALLENLPKIKRVWVPYFICDSMLNQVHKADKEISFYTINEHFSINGTLSLAEDELLLYVNYFGVCDCNVSGILKQYNPDQIVIDCSQAFYSGPYECLATIYSPRKFFGVPDGGLLLTNQRIKPPTEQDCESLNRCTHLLERIGFSAEAGYSNYEAAESSLQDLSPKVMSQLTRRLLSVIDYAAIEKKRNENFRILQLEFGSTNNLHIAFRHNAPLCYPYLPLKKINKLNLIKKRIFIPTYWSEVLQRTSKFSFERNVTDKLLAIPCDQRYDLSDIKKLTAELQNELLS